MAARLAEGWQGGKPAIGRTSAAASPALAVWYRPVYRSRMAGADISWRSHARNAAIGLTLALLYGLVIYGVFHVTEDASVGFISILLLVPFFAPSLAIGIIDPEGRQSARQHAVTGLAVALLMLGAGMVVLDEGGVCTVMAAPFFLLVAPFGAMWSGSNRRAARLRGSETTLRSAAWLALPVIVLPLQQQLPMLFPLDEEVTVDSVIVAATPMIVWNHLVEVRRIRPEELGRTFSQDFAGVPKPTDARLDRRGVGGVRHVQWGPSVTFQEIVTRWQPGRELAWRFAFPSDSLTQSVDRHIDPDSNYLKVADGSYSLADLPGGQTRLTLTTRYRIRTALNAYCKIWGRVFVGDFHANVLRVIKARSEAASA